MVGDELIGVMRWKVVVLRVRGKAQWVFRCSALLVCLRVCMR